MKKTALILLTVLALIPFCAEAADCCKDGKNKREELHNAKIAYFTSRLELTGEESQKFWPVYNSYHKELREATRKKNSCFNAIREATEKGKPSEIEIKKLILNYQEAASGILDIEKIYMDEFQKIIPVQKVALMMVAEEEFRIKMIRMWRHPSPQKEKEDTGK